MNENNKDLEQMLKGDVKIPDSLRPENIEKMLENEIVSPEVVTIKKKTIYRFGLVAAAFAVVVGGTITMKMMSDRSGDYTGAPSNNRTVTTDKGDSKVEEDSKGVSYKEMYDYICQNVKRETAISEKSERAFSNNLDMVVEDSDSKSYTIGASDATASDSYSTTNVRTKGIDEADVVKTDGKYIYALNSDKGIIIVYDTKSEKKCGRLNLDNSEYNRFEMFVEDGKLIVIANSGYLTPFYYGCGVDYYDDVKGGVDYDYRRDDMPKTTVTVYDVTNVRHIEEIDSYTQDGYYTEARLKNGVLYTFSDHRIGNYFYYLEDNKHFSIDCDDYDDYIPEINGTLVPEKDLRIQDGANKNNYTVLSAYSLDKMQVTDEKVVLGGGSNVYMSHESIYLIEEDYADSSAKVCVTKLSYNKGRFDITANAKLDGCLVNTEDENFDENNGYLRMLLSDYDKNYNEYTRLVVLDDELNVTGEIDKIAKRESLKSARYIGDLCFFVTYENTDPLFTADLSDPYNPEIIGKLKIPGFSQYLHPYGNDKLLGIGYDDDGCLKLSMFDISNPKNVKELTTKVYKEYQYAQVLNNPRALYFDEENKTFGFAAQTDYFYRGNDVDSMIVDYLIFDYDGEFSVKHKKNIAKFGNDNYDEDDYEDYDTALNDSRAVYIDDTIYIVNSDLGIYTLDR